MDDKADRRAERKRDELEKEYGTHIAEIEQWLAGYEQAAESAKAMPHGDNVVPFEPRADDEARREHRHLAVSVVAAAAKLLAEAAAERLPSSIGKIAQISRFSPETKDRGSVATLTVFSSDCRIRLVSVNSRSCYSATIW
jgi:hypothetical protein